MTGLRNSQLRLKPAKARAAALAIRHWPNKAGSLVRITRVGRTKVENPMPELRKSPFWKNTLRAYHAGPIRPKFRRAGDLLDPAYKTYE